MVERFYDHYQTSDVPGKMVPKLADMIYLDWERYCFLMFPKSWNVCLKDSL